MNNPNFIIRNSKSTPRTRGDSRQQSQLNSERFMATMEHFRKTQQQQDTTIQDRICQLQGNLKLIEKKYRQNLKQGFDNKIKAYRLQAVVERKLLRQAIEETQKDQQEERIKQKIDHKERLKRLSEEKYFLYYHQQKQKEQFYKQKHQEEKRKTSLTLYERERQRQKQKKELHDRIALQSANADRKRRFLDDLRAVKIRKDTHQAKRQLLEKVVKNTDKLKELKLVLQDFQSYPLIEETFLTM